MKTLATFTIVNQEAYDADVKANMDGGYAQAILEFACRWAAAAEKRVDGGEKFEDIIQICEREADTEGITGFMYGCAVGFLSRAWKYGEQLRRWSNLKTQIGTEGEKANETGGVLNPALLNLG